MIFVEILFALEAIMLGVGLGLLAFEPSSLVLLPRKKKK